ncbi:MFS transporter [Sphingobium sp. CR2-8]|uniref:MFS transporter n=1 Tax=Sphingobium sp. CR2-8 TaxID=1306534 RepID=UPI002DBAC4BA|nr:MFS transporter [Sphingobium sp. CR2-8]MEC3909171.1 MFS transporter [Sphingobium sp. CR2-8]
MTNSVTLNAEPSEWRQHWRVALGATVGNGTGVALYTYISSLFIPSLQAEFGWSRGEIATAQGIGCVGVLAAPFVGRAIDRFGVRVMSTIGALMIGALYLGYASLSGSLVTLTFLMAGMLIAAPANSGPVFAKTLTGWFVKNRGLALGLTACGIPLLAMVAPFALHYVISDYGWRAGYLSLGGLVVIVGLPIVLATLREPPGEADLDGGVTADTGPTLRDAARTRAFWLLLAAVIFCTAPAQGFLSQLTPLVTDNGFTTADAALFLSLYSGAVVIGRVGTGVLLDRLPPYHVAFAVTLVPAIGLMILIALPAPDFWVAALAIAIIGIQNGGESDILPYFIAREFGFKSYSAISGVMFTAMFIASAFGVTLLGQVYDYSGSYNGALVAFVAFFFIAATSYFLIGARRAPRTETFALATQ